MLEQLRWCSLWKFLLVITLANASDNFSRNSGCGLLQVCHLWEILGIPPAISFVLDFLSDLSSGDSSKKCRQESFWGFSRNSFKERHQGFFLGIPLKSQSNDFSKNSNCGLLHDFFLVFLHEYLLWIFLYFSKYSCWNFSRNSFRYLFWTSERFPEENPKWFC